jgi:hypothetical protein
LDLTFLYKALGVKSSFSKYDKIIGNLAKILT